MKKFTPYLVTAGVVVAVLIVLKMTKSMLPAFIANLLPF